DYYPFGMLLTNRNGNSSEYRYGFNGMEKDDELKGEGNSYEYGGRMLDPRIGRWFKIDLEFKKLPSYTPYNFVKNSPLRFIDPDGNFNIDVHKRITSMAFAKSKMQQTTKNYQVLEDYRRGIVGTGIFDGGVVAPDTRYIKHVVSGGMFGVESIHEEHFDEMNYQEIMTNFDRVNTGIRQILEKYESGKVTNYELGRNIGEYFHAIQDFYSHSNFIEIYEEVYGQTSVDDIPTLQEALTLKEHEKFANILKKRLKTGNTTHDEGQGSHKEMNHDLGGDSSVWKEVTPGTKGKTTNWNTKAAEAAATRATIQVNDKIESKLKADTKKSKPKQSVRGSIRSAMPTF
ncbi:RHS repeat domain-containing protein, partial [Aquimarina rubra]